jgi:hypothetical protein
LAGPDAGMVSVEIDGGEATTHNLFHRFSKGLNYPRSVIFHSGLREGEHTLKLRVLDKKNESSKGNAVSILMFEVNG